MLSIDELCIISYSGYVIPDIPPLISEYLLNVIILNMMKLVLELYCVVFC